jgi:hypothetical protein
MRRRVRPVYVAKADLRQLSGIPTSVCKTNEKLQSESEKFSVIRGVHASRVSGAFPHRASTSRIPDKWRLCSCPAVVAVRTLRPVHAGRVRFIARRYR